MHSCQKNAGPTQWHTQDTWNGTKRLEETKEVRPSDLQFLCSKSRLWKPSRRGYRGGELQTGKTGYVRIVNEGKEKVMRDSNMNVIPEVPVAGEDLKDWKRHEDPESTAFWKNERTGKMTRKLPKFEEEIREKPEDEPAGAPWKEVRRRKRVKGPPNVEAIEVKSLEAGLVTRTVDLKKI